MLLYDLGDQGFQSSPETLPENHQLAEFNLSLTDRTGEYYKPYDFNSMRDFVECPAMLDFYKFFPFRGLRHFRFSYKYEIIHRLDIVTWSAKHILDRNPSLETFCSDPCFPVAKEYPNVLQAKVCVLQLFHRFPATLEAFPNLKTLTSLADHIDGDNYAKSGTCHLPQFVFDLFDGSALHGRPFDRLVVFKYALWDTVRAVIQGRSFGLAIQGLPMLTKLVLEFVNIGVDAIRYLQDFMENRAVEVELDSVKTPGAPLKLPDKLRKLEKLVVKVDPGNVDLTTLRYVPFLATLKATSVLTWWESPLRQLPFHPDFLKACTNLKTVKFAGYDCSSFKPILALTWLEDIRIINDIQKTDIIQKNQEFALELVRAVPGLKKLMLQTFQNHEGFRAFKKQVSNINPRIQVSSIRMTRNV
jgi:hypothetical protein